MKRNVKYLALILIFAVALGLLGCDAAKEPAESVEESTQEVVTTEAETTVEEIEVVEAKPGKVRGKVLSDNGDMLVAGIIVVDEENNSYRTSTNAYGGYYLELQPGHYTLTFDKGMEFSQKTVEIDVESLKTYYLQDVRLTALYDAYSEGWVAGDTHEHTNFSDGADTVEDLMVKDASAGLYWGFLTDHNTSRGVPEWREASVNVLTDEEGNDRMFVGFAGSEVTTEFGHFNSLGTGMTFDKYEIGFTEAERASSQKNDYAREKIIYIAEETKRLGALAQMNHPYSLTNMGAMNFLAEDDFEAFYAFDTIEIWNAYFVIPDGRFEVQNGDNQNYRSKLLWYSILNEVKNGGKFIAATGGTDNHDATGPADAETRSTFDQASESISNYQNYCRYGAKYAGSVRDYVFLDGAEVTQENVNAALKAGHNFITNGPILNLRANGAIYGETIEVENGTATLTGELFCREGMETLRIVKNGETIEEMDLSGAMECEVDTTIEGLQSGDWFLIEVLGDWGVYAISNPFFVK